MKRRDFLKGAAGLAALAALGTGTSYAKTSAAKKMIKPKRLVKGDTIGIITPSSGVGQESFDAALQRLAEFGFKTKIGKNARRDEGIYAAGDKERIEDIHWAFSDPEVDAIWCIGGGYGATRILPALDYKLIRRNPKILVGYSDITALHLAIFQQTGLVTFHGPVATSSFSDYAKMHVFNVLMNPSAPYKIEIAPGNIEKAKEAPLFKTETLIKGKARGRLIGGNLSLVSAMAGTPYGLKDLKGKILFLEDIREAPYRLDRMLTQLRQSVDLRQLAGVALGVFEGCESRGGGGQTAQEVLRERFGDLGIPVVYGLSFGHIRDQFTLPLGIEAELDADNATMTFLETGVI